MSEQLDRLSALLDEALDMPPEQRADLVTRCEPPELRAELAALLELTDKPGPLDHPPARLAAEAASRQELGRYRLLKPIGQGGMGLVYRARDAHLEREVAIKILTPDAHACAQVLEEARAACSLNHPNVVTVFEVAQHDGTDFIVMEHIDGEPLSTVIRRRIDMKPALDYCLQITAGLAAAHSKGLVHRDIKPANVMVTPEGRLKLLDFGVARQAKTADGGDLASRAVEVTRSVPAGPILGTLGYLAPELLEGGEADTRSDVFALGATLYQLIAGKKPFGGGSDMSVIAATLRDTPPPLTEVRPDTPRALARIIDRCLARSPEDRYQSAVEVLDELTRLSETELKPAPRRRGAKWRAGPGGYIAAALIVIALALAGVGFYTWQHRAPPPGTDAAEARFIAVLPFDNLSADAGDDYFVNGITDDVLSHLALVPGLSVISRTTTMTYKNSDKHTPEIARELGAHYLLEGSVRRAEGRARISVQLVDGETDQYVWAEIFDRELEDIFSVQSEIARTVAAALKAQLSPRVAERIERVPTGDMEAYQLFLRGRDNLYRYDPAGIRQAMNLFEQALQRDPAFALARAWLGRAQAMYAYNQGLGPEGAALAVSTSRRAVDDQPDLSDAWTALGTALMESGRYRDATGAFEQALELNPNDAIAISNFGVLSSMRGEFGRAIRLERRSQELRGASQHRRHAALAGYYLLLGQTDRAETELDWALAVAPGSTEALRAQATLALARGRFEDAHEAALRLTEHAPDNPGAALEAAWYLIASGDIDRAREMAEITYTNSPITLRTHLVGVLYGYTLERTGEPARGQTVLANAADFAAGLIGNGHESPALRYALACIHALRGQADTAFDWLDQAIEFGWNRALMTELDPLLENLRGDPRYESALDRMTQNLAAMRERVEGDEL